MIRKSSILIGLLVATLATVAASCFPTKEYIRDQKSAIDTLSTRYLGYVLAEGGAKLTEEVVDELTRPQLIAAWKARMAAKKVEPKEDLKVVKVMGPELRAYVKADSTLSDLDQDTILFNLATWQLLTEEASR